jgi:hypothetical protein
VITKEQFYALKPGDVVVDYNGLRLVVKYPWHDEHPHHPVIVHEEDDPDCTFELRYFNEEIVDDQYGALKALNNLGARIELAAAA